MGKLGKRVFVCFCAVVLAWCGALLADRQRLHEEVIRLHVVANSDSEADQSVKLLVRDAVMESLRGDLEKIGNVEAAKNYLQENLPKIQEIANDTLKMAGFSQNAVVTLCKEAFDTRHYDTFSLPAGVYEALRIVIGEGAGHNWWCVVFPTLCLSGAAEDFADTASAAGFPDSLTAAMTGKSSYEVRFYLLDAMGRLENIFFSG